MELYTTRALSHGGTQHCSQKCRILLYFHCPLGTLFINLSRVECAHSFYTTSAVGRGWEGGGCGVAIGAHHCNNEHFLFALLGPPPWQSPTEISILSGKTPRRSQFWNALTYLRWFILSLKKYTMTKKLLDIVSDLVRFCVFNERISSRLINLSNVLKITRHGLNTLEL